MTSITPLRRTWSCGALYLFLDPDEERRLVEAAREPLRSIILAGIYAGLRIESEALTLRTGDVDLRTGLLTSSRPTRRAARAGAFP